MNVDLLILLYSCKKLLFISYLQKNSKKNYLIAKFKNYIYIIYTLI